MAWLSRLTTEQLKSLEQWLKSSPSERTLAEIEALTGLGTEATLDRWCPHKPWPKQATFIGLTCKEAFYGGGAGPGKTDALLLDVLQSVHVPQFSALILRRDFPRLSLPNSIMARAKEWLLSTDARWHGGDKMFSFPSGATLQFGYIDNPDDRFRYASSEYQYIGFDELTEFRLADDESNPYTFLFSRLRKTRDNPVPLKVRSASNPGNIGHQWVLRRFVTTEAIDSLRDGQPRVFYADQEGQRAFVPALLRDNPALDPEEYEASLSHLAPVTRARLMRGDWSVVEDAIIPVAWLREWRQAGQPLVPLAREGQTLPPGRDARDLPRLCPIDTAGTSHEIARKVSGKTPSWTVAAVWDYDPQNDWLFLRHIWRDRVGWDDLKTGIQDVVRRWGPRTTIVENAHWGKPLAAELRQNTPNVELFNPQQKGLQGKGRTGQPGKLERSTQLQNMLSEGRIFLPAEENSGWRLDLEAEWLSWTGHEDEPADQIDVASMAAIHCRGSARSQQTACEPAWRTKRQDRWGWDALSRGARHG